MSIELMALQALATLLAQISLKSISGWLAVHPHGRSTASQEPVGTATSPNSHAQRCRSRACMVPPCPRTDQPGAPSMRQNPASRSRVSCFEHDASTTSAPASSPNPHKEQVQLRLCAQGPSTPAPHPLTCHLHSDAQQPRASLLQPLTHGLTLAPSDPAPHVQKRQDTYTA